MSAIKVTDEAAQLRAAMVESIRTWTTISEATAEALRKVERHQFVPAVPLSEAYTDDTVVTRRDANDVATSSSSAPWLMALMLDQLELAPGMRVLEIGAGTGYNAGLIAELVGPTGYVTAVEIQPDVAEDARTALAWTGVANVEVVCGDGEYGHPGGAPYDRIIATAGAWDVPDAWFDQLKPDGVMVVPLRMRGLTRAVALKRDDGVWRSLSAVNCGFMPIRGDGEMPERNIRVADDVIARIDDGPDVDTEALQQAITGRGEVEWAGVLTDRSLDLLDFYMADLDGFCRILAPPSITERGLIEPMNGWGSMGVATAGTLGYLTKRASNDNPRVWELGACAYGPAAAKAVAELARRIRWWGEGRETVTAVRIEIHPLSSDNFTDAIMTVDKRHSCVVVRPETRSQA